MGLNIIALTYSGEKTYSEKFGSYGRLHILRDWIFTELLGKPKIEEKYKPDGPTYYDGEYGDYPALLNHSDADGYYLSFSEFGIKEVYNVDWCGNLDKLRKEMQELLNNHTSEMPDDVLAVFNSLYGVVNSHDQWNENKCSILVFN